MILLMLVVVNLVSLRSVFTWLKDYLPLNTKKRRYHSSLLLAVRGAKELGLECSKVRFSWFSNSAGDGELCSTAYYYKLTRTHSLIIKIFFAAFWFLWRCKGFLSISVSINCLRHRVDHVDTRLDQIYMLLRWWSLKHGSKSMQWSLIFRQRLPINVNS